MGACVFHSKEEHQVTEALSNELRLTSNGATPKHKRTSLDSNLEDQLPECTIKSSNSPQQSRTSELDDKLLSPTANLLRSSMENTLDCVTTSGGTSCRNLLSECSLFMTSTISIDEDGTSTHDSQSSEDSECPGRKRLVSFDGINMRVTNRYEIGLEVLKAKIHHGANPRMSTHGGRTALMFAVLAKDFDFIKELIELGCNVNETTSIGETALSLANETQMHDIAEYLRSKGATESV